MKENEKGAADMAEEEFEIMSDHWCLKIFCAFECKLLEFQQYFLLPCAPQPI